MVVWQLSNQIVEAKRCCRKVKSAPQVSGQMSSVSERPLFVTTWTSSSDTDVLLDGGRSNTYMVRDAVMLLRPKYHQKLLTAYEPGWIVREVVSPTTVVIEDADKPEQQKVVNVELLKLYTPDVA